MGTMSSPLAITQASASCLLGWEQNCQLCREFLKTAADLRDRQRLTAPSAMIAYLGDLQAQRRRLPPRSIRRHVVLPLNVYRPRLPHVASGCHTYILCQALVGVGLADRPQLLLADMSYRDNASIEIIRDRVVYSNQYGHLHDDDVRFQPADTEGRYIRWQWRAPYSVAVLPLVDANTAILVRNFRHSARRDVLETVKGFGTSERSPGEVARIELREELGYSVDELTFLGTTYSDPGFAYHPMQCFLATGRVDRKAAPERSETIQGAREFTVTDTPKALQSGEVQDSVTLLLLWHALYKSWVD
jgi:ADP-ribose pyrophosphatase